MLEGGRRSRRMTRSTSSIRRERSRKLLAASWRGSKELRPGFARRLLYPWPVSSSRWPRASTLPWNHQAASAHRPEAAQGRRLESVTGRRRRMGRRLRRGRRARRPRRGRPGCRRQRRSGPLVNPRGRRAVAQAPPCVFAFDRSEPALVFVEGRGDSCRCTERQEREIEPGQGHDRYCEEYGPRPPGPTSGRPKRP